MTKKEKKNLDVRPEIIYKNYDYGQQTKSEKENTKLGPGTGMYENLDKYKSVKDFVDTDRKMKKKKRKAALDSILDSSLKSQIAEITKKVADYLQVLDASLDSFASGIIGDVEIPKEVLEKIKKDKLEDKKPKEESEEITKDETITGIPFANKIDAGPSYDELLTYPNGELFDNDVNRNSYYGIYSLQGNSMFNEISKLAEIYYKLAQNSQQFSKDDWLPKSINFAQPTIEEDKSNNKSITFADVQGFKQLFSTLEYYGLIKPINGGLYLSDWQKIIDYFSKRSYGQWKQCNDNKVNPEVTNSKLNYYNYSSNLNRQLMSVKQVLDSAGPNNDSFILTPERIEKYLQNTTKR